ncbi:MAG: DUF3473 domain-containing protein, partial [bacterium]
MQPTILITIDVEDWFQVENFKPWIPFNTWDQRELRVEKNVHRLLNLFDSVELKANSSKLIDANDSTNSINPISPSNLTNHGNSLDFRCGRIARPVKFEDNLTGELSRFHQETEKLNKSSQSIKSCQPKKDKTNPFRNNNDNGPQTIDYGRQKKLHATFFVLGWIAERLPHLVREIQFRGHEVASHGYYHKLYNQMTSEELKKDLIDSKKLLEDISGSAVYGFRAPSFSVSDDILKTIEDCGYRYDSSYNSFIIHKRYGQVSLNENGKWGVAYELSPTFYELPISNLNLRKAISSGRNDKKRFALPWGGGAYFRLLFFPLFEIGVKNILQKENAYLFYLHPWEIDPEQPRIEEASLNYKFRQYVNLSQTHEKLASLFKSFSDCHFVTC